MHAFARPSNVHTTSPDGWSAAARSRVGLQPKLHVGAVDDPLEREADRVADALTQGQAAGSISRAVQAPQRKCADCEAEEGLQRKCASCGPDGAVQRQSAETAAQAVASGGRPLAPELRAYFEPRLGRDLSEVRVHTDAEAGAAARGIEARAYTLGRHVAFAPGEYALDDPAGRHLLAHELTHVAQQAGQGAGPIRRTLAASSVCPANAAGAGATPLDDLRTADAEAQRMTLGASNVLALEALTFRDPTFGPSYVAAAYRRRFGSPTPNAAGQFRNRFNNRNFPNQGAAEASEMVFLADRFRRQSTFLAGAVRYRCPGAATITAGGCTARCAAHEFAWTCVPTDARTIVICPLFWTLSGPQQAGAIVHESVHMRLDVKAHASGSLAQRGANPECYTSLILDLYGQGVPAATLPQFSPADPKCPPI